jgi:acetyl/propionyl-CoA carboxylase alpha subunit
LRLSADGVRVDTGVREGDEVSVFYDPMIAKVIAWDETREGAAAKLSEALADSEIAGVTTNAGFLARALRHPDFVSGEIDTGFIERRAEALIGPDTQPSPEILARAALFLVGERRSGSRSTDPWDAQDGFRLHGDARELIEFVCSGTRLPVEIVHRAGSAMAVKVAGALIAEPAHAAAVRLSTGEIAVMQDGETRTISVHDPFAIGDSSGAATDRVTAPMPGKIVQLFVHAGEDVKRGQPLAVLEAMKMEHTLKAVADAHVESVDVSAGEQVQEGATVVRFAQNTA